MHEVSEKHTGSLRIGVERGTVELEGRPLLSRVQLPQATALLTKTVGREFLCKCEVKRTRQCRVVWFLERLVPGSRAVVGILSPSLDGRLHTTLGHH